MASLTEVATFIEEILRLDLTTPIKGFDSAKPDEVGVSNQQAQALANRTKWLKEQLEGLSDSLKDILEAKYVISVNDQTGAVEVTLKTLGAAAAVHTHTPNDIKTDGDETKQFVSAEEKESWSNKLSASDIATLHKKSLVGTGNITLTYEDVGADMANAATKSMEAHLAENDPHSQYLKSTDAATTYVTTESANKENGYLKLDENGNIPASLGKLFEVHYHIVKDQAGRLALDKSTNITICLQLDEDMVYYLDASKEPGVNENWLEGRSTDVTHVNSFNGRWGVVAPQKDDYDAEQIKETDNRTFITPAERTSWDGKLSKLVDGKDIVTLNEKSLVGPGTLDLTSDDIGADKKGTAKELMDDHISSSNDPHPQYLLVDTADSRYVGLDTANKENGYLKLDANGQIPPNLGAGLKARYTTAGNKTERLAIDQSDDLIICLQRDEDRMYYLNPGLDPKEEGNWEAGREGGAIVGGVSTVFGRNGDVIAMEGDYTADQITTDANNRFVTDEQIKSWTNKQGKLTSSETLRTVCKQDLLGEGDVALSSSDISTTDDALFVSQTEKDTWNSKQNALVSGVDIRKLNGNDLLGSEELVLSTDDISATDNNQYVTPAEKTTWSGKQDALGEDKIKEWDGKQNALTSGETIATVFGKSLLSGGDIDIADAKNLAKTVNEKLKAGSGIKIELDEDADAITVTNVAMGATTPTIIELDNVVAGRGYRYKLSGVPFNADFKVYKYVHIFGEANVTIDYDNPDVKLVVSELPAVDEFNGWPNGQPDVKVTVHSVSDQVELYQSDDLTTGNISTLTDGVALYCENTLENVVPYFTADGTKENFTIIADSYYSAIGSYNPWKAFQAQLASNQKNPVPQNQYWSPTNQWNPEVVNYLGVKNTTAFKVTGYGFQNFTSLPYADNLSSPPTAWVFQARNEDTDEWTVLDTQSGQNIMNGEDGWTTYRLDKTYIYKQYRVVIKAVSGTGRVSIPRFAICNNVGMLVKDKNGRYLTADEFGDYEIVDVKTALDFRNACFNTPKRPLPVSLFKHVEPVRVCTLKEIPATIKQYGVEPVIALQNPITKRTFWDGLKDINPKEYYSDNSDLEIRYAATIDGEMYYVYNDGWEEVGRLSTTKTSALLLLQSGMTSEAFTDITEEQWAELLKKTTGEPILGVAFARYVTSTGIPVTPKTIEIEFDEIDGWEVQSFDQTNIRFTDDFVIFNPTEDGKYRFSYRFEE